MYDAKLDPASRTDGGTVIIYIVTVIAYTAAAAYVGSVIISSSVRSQPPAGVAELSFNCT